MKNSLLLIIVVISIASFGQSLTLNDFEVDSIPNSDIFKNTKSTNKPPTFEKTWNKLKKNDRESWKIKKVNNSIKISQDDFNYFKGDKLPFNEK